MNRLSLINALRGPVPPDGYKYVDPVSGFRAHSFDYTDWVDQERKHLTANGREVPLDLEIQMQEQLCMTLPPGWCNYDPPNAVTVHDLDWPDVMAAAARFSGWLLKGMPTVDQNEADRRAMICTRCYLNVHVGGCSVCQAAVAKLSEGLTSKHDAYLKSCAACKCNLKAKVHFPISSLDKENPGVQKLYPDHCWLNKSGVNYRG